jgi:threonine/homoserine/homoserine lactone efflux protein
MVAAIGTSAGVAVYATATLLGISALTAALPWLVTVIQVLGGAYLVYLGLSALRSAMSKRSGLASTGNFPDDEKSSLMRNLGKAFLVSLSNPKMAAFFFGLFAPFVGLTYSSDGRLLVLCGVVLIDLAYHQALANGLAVLGASKPAKQAGRWLDALTGTLMTAFGFRLLVEAARTR